MVELDGIPSRGIVNGGPGVGIEVRRDVDVKVVDGQWKIDEKEDEGEEKKFEESAGTQA